MFLFGGRTFHPVGTAVAAVIGILIGWLRAGSMKASMNNVAKKHQARKYLSEQSVRMGASRDLFLFSKTEKREKAKKQQT